MTQIADLRAAADAERAESNRLRDSFVSKLVVVELLERKAEAVAEIPPLAALLSDAHAAVLAAELPLAQLDAELAEVRRRQAVVGAAQGDKSLEVRLDARAVRVSLAEELAELETLRAELAAVLVSVKHERELARQRHDAAVARVATLDRALEDPLHDIEGKASEAYIMSACLGGQWVGDLLAVAGGQPVSEFDAALADAMLMLTLAWSGRGGELTEQAAKSAVADLIRTTPPVTLPDGRRVVVGAA